MRRVIYGLILVCFGAFLLGIYFFNTEDPELTSGEVPSVTFEAVDTGFIPPEDMVISFEPSPISFYIEEEAIEGLTLSTDSGEVYKISTQELITMLLWLRHEARYYNGK